jgi:hypothetical protein
MTTSFVVLFVVCVVPCLAFHHGIPSSHILGKRNTASLCGVRTFSAANSQERHVLSMHLTRRNIGAMVVGALSQVLVPSGNKAYAEDSALLDWKLDAANGFSNYTAGDLGIKYKDIEIGLGIPPKKGDFVRFQLSAYLLDGTLASSYAGVELAQANPALLAASPPFSRTQLFSSPDRQRCRPAIIFI